LMQDMQSLDGMMAELRTLAGGGDCEVEPICYVRRLGEIEDKRSGVEGEIQETPVAEAGKVMLF